MCLHQERLPKREVVITEPPRIVRRRPLVARASVNMWLACSIRNMTTKPAIPIHIPCRLRNAGIARNVVLLELMPLAITGKGQYPHQLRALTAMEKIIKGHHKAQTTRFARLFFSGPKSV